MLKVARKPRLQQMTAFCKLPSTKLVIDGYGNAYMCCYQKHSLGNLLQDDLLTIWNSPLANEIREETFKGSLHKVCTAWNACPFLVIEKEPVQFAGYHDFPSVLDLSLPDTHCNIGGEEPSESNPACIMCARNWAQPVQPQITRQICERAKVAMPYLHRLTIMGTAEPFWKGLVFEALDVLGFADHKDHITFHTNNNGTCLVGKMVDRFFETVERSDICFSIDAASPESYIKIRRIDGYEKVVSNLKAYVAARNEHGKEKHQVSIYNNINIFNVHEMAKMVAVAAETGVDKIVMLPTDDHQLTHNGMADMVINQHNAHLFKQNAELAREMADRLGVVLEYWKAFDVVPPARNYS